MKKIFFACLLVLNTPLFSQVNNLPDFFEEANDFFKDHVVNGKVDYKTIAKDPKDLNNLVAFIGRRQAFPAPATEKAFYINAYNILVIKGITEFYPVKGPMTIPGFFEKNLFTVNGAKRTLNFLENEILRKKFPDARMHFALVCGAISCPPLPSYAITPGKMDTQLSELAIKTVRNPNLTRIDRQKNKAELSMIFNWYKDDFISSKGSIINFLNQYLEAPLPQNITITHYDYNWSLNGR